MIDEAAEPARVGRPLETCFVLWEVDRGMKFEGHLEGRAFVARPPRVDISFEVLVRSAAGDFEASITNLSGRGFRLRSPQALEPGEEVSLKVGKLPPVQGVIRWVAGRDAGGTFTEAVAL